MDPNLHQQQGINHLRRVLGYAPFVAEAGPGGAAGRAVVHLTPEDWHVVADTLFTLGTPREMLPEEIQGFDLANENATIRLHTDALVIDVERM